MGSMYAVFDYETNRLYAFPSFRVLYSLPAFNDVTNDADMQPYALHSDCKAGCSDALTNV